LNLGMVARSKPSDGKAWLFVKREVSPELAEVYGYLGFDAQSTPSLAALADAVSQASPELPARVDGAWRMPDLPPEPLNVAKPIMEDLGWITPVDAAMVGADNEDQQIAQAEAVDGDQVVPDEGAEGALGDADVEAGFGS
jgi:hypothetical protein